MTAETALKWDYLETGSYVSSDGIYRITPQGQGREWVLSCVGMKPWRGQTLEGAKIAAERHALTGSFS